MLYVPNIKSNIAFLLIFILSACHTEKDNQTPVAEVYGEVLYLEKIPREIYEGKPAEDSLLALKKYIDQWVRNTVLSHYAEKNIDTVYVNRLTDAYRKSLSMDLYETQLAERMFDTVKVSGQELKDYYEKNPHNFISGDTLIQWRFLIVKSRDPRRWKYKKWFFSSRPEDQRKLEPFYGEFLAYKPDSTGWISFHRAKTVYPALKLRAGTGKKQIVSISGDRMFMLDILQTVYPGETLPFDYAHDRIVTFVKKRKIFRYLKNIKNDMVREAIKKKQVKVYIKPQKNN